MTDAIIRETVDRAVALGTHHGKIDAFNAVLDVMAQHLLYRSPAYQQIQRMLKDELEAAYKPQVTKEQVT